MALEVPTVKVWEPGAGSWELAALPIDDAEDLTAELRHLDMGSWSMRLPAAHEAVTELARADAYFERLVTIDWQGRFRLTGLVADSDRTRTADDDVLDVGGPSAIQLLDWALTYPDPTLPLSGQGSQADAFPASGTAPAEDVVQHFVAAHFRDRWAAGSLVPPVVAASQGRGGQVRGRVRMRKLWPVVQTLSRRGGIGISVDLVETSATRANLTVSFYLPADRTGQARLSEDLDVLRSWTATRAAPSVTGAIVGDAGAGTARKFVLRTRGSAASWGGRVESFVNANDTFDPAELVQRGDEALDEGAGQSAFTLEAEDTELVRYGVDYGLGDTVLVQVESATATDQVSAVSLAVTGDGVVEKPIVGDPDKPDPLFRLGSTIRATRRQVDRSGAQT